MFVSSILDLQSLVLTCRNWANNFSDWISVEIERVGGSGLGLSIVESIVDAHGGEVHCNSGPEKGMEVTVTLPIAPEN